MSLHLPPENDDGNVEYKRHLCTTSADRIMRLTGQLKHRIEEGNGEAIYEIGVEDNGFARGISRGDLDISLENLRTMANSLKAVCTVLAEREVVSDASGASIPLFVAEVLVRINRTIPVDVRIAIVGGADQAKSTVIGVLTRGLLDNGRGAARSHVLTHRHEVETGRTSTISQHLMGFDGNGQVTNYSLMRNFSDWPQIVAHSSKLITFLDMAGQEMYIRTTCRGLTGGSPDYAAIVVAANHGISPMTKEHFGIIVALRVPMFVLITKTDIAPEHVKKQTIDDVNRMLKLPGMKKMPVMIRSIDDVLFCIRSLRSLSDRTVAIFQVSNVTGEGLELVRMFLNLLPPHNMYTDRLKDPAEVILDERWHVTGVGTVVSGLVVSGAIQTGDMLFLGPDKSGYFLQTQIKSIHHKRVVVHRVEAGMNAAFALRKIKVSFFRRGMVLATATTATAYWEFEADVLVLPTAKSTNLTVGAQLVVHTRNVRQTVKVVSIKTTTPSEDDVKVLHSGERAFIRFRLCVRPEVLHADTRVIFREGRVKALGNMKNLHCPVKIHVERGHPGYE